MLVRTFVNTLTSHEVLKFNSFYQYLGTFLSIEYNSKHSTRIIISRLINIFNPCKPFATNNVKTVTTKVSRILINFEPC